MQKINNLRQKLFCLILSRYIVKGDSGLRLDIHLGIALSELHKRTAISSSTHFLHELS